jgi:hypothetical protein
MLIYKTNIQLQISFHQLPLSDDLYEAKICIIPKAIYRISLDIGLDLFLNEKIREKLTFYKIEYVI